MLTKPQAKAIRKYESKNYEYVRLRFNKGDREKVKKMAEEQGKSMNQFILDKIFNSDK